MQIAAERPAASCYDDKTALRLIDALRHVDLRVPEDIPVADFDNIPLAATSNSRLSTVAEPARDMGRASEPAPGRMGHCPGGPAGLASKPGSR